jgi:hypothetical protein
MGESIISARIAKVREYVSTINTSITVLNAEELLFVVIIETNRAAKNVEVQTYVSTRKGKTSAKHVRVPAFAIMVKFVHVAVYAMDRPFVNIPNFDPFAGIAKVPRFAVTIDKSRTVMTVTEVHFAYIRDIGIDVSNAKGIPFVHTINTFIAVKYAMGRICVNQHGARRTKTPISRNMKDIVLPVL